MRPLKPHPHQRVLQQWQLVGIRAKVIQQPVDERAIDLASEHARRPFDGQRALLTRQARDEVRAAVDRLRQIAKERAVAEVIRSHREDDVDRHRARRGRRQEQRHEGVRLFRIALRPEAKHLFELIHEHEQIRVAAQVGLAHDFDEAQWAAAQRRLDVQRRIRLVGALAAEQRRREQALARGGASADRRAA